MQWWRVVNCGMQSRLDEFASFGAVMMRVGMGFTERGGDGRREAVKAVMEEELKEWCQGSGRERVLMNRSRG